jgi:uncharacterized protein (DUF305 family)
MTKLTLSVAALLAAVSSIAWAEDSMKGMDHSGHGAAGAYMQAMDKMQDAMKSMKMTGDPDRDFVIMMIPHHQAAIDMAKVELAQGKDEATRKLAQDIVSAQEKEIADMKAWLAKRE